jgi:hypothetical protein
MARPKGAKDKAPRITAAAKQARAASSEGLTPLEYMLTVMRDSEAEPERRDRMASSAAPYIHPRLASTELTGKGGGPVQVNIIKFGKPVPNGN